MAPRPIPKPIKVRESLKDLVDYDLTPLSMKPGPRSKYRKEYAAIAAKLTLRGSTEQEIADILGIALSTLKEWRFMHDEFGHALQVNKEALDSRIEATLAQRALGYEKDVIRPLVVGKNIKFVRIREQIPPSDQALQFWLTNRKRDEWRRTSNATDDADSEKITITVKGGLPEKRAIAESTLKSATVRRMIDQKDKDNDAPEIIDAKVNKTVVKK